MARVSVFGAGGGGLSQEGTPPQVQCLKQLTVHNMYKVAIEYWMSVIIPIKTVVCYVNIQGNNLVS